MCVCVCERERKREMITTGIKIKKYRTTEAKEGERDREGDEN